METFAKFNQVLPLLHKEPQRILTFPIIMSARYTYIASRSPIMAANMQISGDMTFAPATIAPVLISPRN